MVEQEVFDIISDPRLISGFCGGINCGNYTFPPAKHNPIANRSLVNIVKT